MAPKVGPLQYNNRHGVPFYLHQGTTKTGKPKYYVARTVGAGALAEMPAGFEFTESVNGVVSVRRVDESPRLVGDGDLEVVRQEMSRHHHLRHHRVELGKNEIVIYEQVGAMSAGEVEEQARMCGMTGSEFELRMADLWAKRRYQPVMKFVVGAGQSLEYAVHRMTYRGEGGWSYPLAHGPLARLVADFVPPIGTQQFFDLW